jgi:hypothetical protein
MTPGITPGISPGINPGTSANAGVAQTAHNAQQIARQRDRRRADEAKNAARLKKNFEMRLAAPEEVEHEHPAASLHVDGHVPQQQHQQPLDKLEVRHRSDESADDQADPPDAAQSHASGDRPDTASHASSESPEGGGLYRHLDLTA